MISFRASAGGGDGGRLDKGLCLRELKNGIEFAMMKAKIQVATRRRQVISKRQVVLEQGKREMHTQDGSPGDPADNGVLALVARIVEDAQEDEAGRDGGVEDAEEDDGGDHEGEGDLLVYGLQRPEGGARHILVPGVGVYGASHDAEHDDLENCARPQGLREVSRFLHLGDEAGQGDLADERVADVEEGIEATDEGCRGQRYHGHDRFA